MEKDRMILWRSTADERRASRQATLEIAANIATEIPRTEGIEIWVRTAAGIPAVCAR